LASPHGQWWLTGRPTFILPLLTVCLQLGTRPGPISILEKIRTLDHRTEMPRFVSTGSELLRAFLQPSRAPSPSRADPYFRYWPVRDMPVRSDHVRLSGQTESHHLRGQTDAIDLKRSFALIET